MSVPDDRRYSQDHQWVQPAGESWRVGLTDFAQDALGEVTVVQLFDSGLRVAAGDEMGEVEAFKAMTDLYMPVAATIVDFNAQLIEEPTIVNTDPYGAGWLCTVRLDDPADMETLLDAAAYRALIGAEAA